MKSAGFSPCLASTKRRIRFRAFPLLNKYLCMRFFHLDYCSLDTYAKPYLGKSAKTRDIFDMPSPELLSFGTRIFDDNWYNVIMRVSPGLSDMTAQTRQNRHGIVSGDENNKTIAVFAGSSCLPCPFLISVNNHVLPVSNISFTFLPLCILILSGVLPLTYFFGIIPSLVGWLL